MGAHHRRVDQRQAQVEFPAFGRFQIPGDHGPLGHAVFHPPLPAHVDRVVIAVGTGQVAPGAAGALSVEHGLEGQAVADLLLEPRAAPALGKGGFDLRPLHVVQVQESVLVVHAGNLPPPAQTSNVL